MIRQTDLGVTRFAQLRALVGQVRRGTVTLGGNSPGKIYGTLNCRAGKRMKAKNRVFFRDEKQAIDAGFRPCAVCLRGDYTRWRETEKS